jgi:precorrin-6Y C5,15-methyltransferase (decarboxylating)
MGLSSVCARNPQNIEHIVPLNTIAIEVIPEPEAAIIALASGLDDAFF